MEVLEQPASRSDSSGDGELVVELDDRLASWTSRSGCRRRRPQRLVCSIETDNLNLDAEWQETVVRVPRGYLRVGVGDVAFDEERMRTHVTASSRAQSASSRTLIRKYGRRCQRVARPRQREQIQRLSR